MKKLILAAALGATSLALAACGDKSAGNTDAGNVSAMGGDNAVPADENGAATTTTTSTTSTSAFPKGARIVQENGATYRIDADGTRVKLTDSDSRIVIENGTRYRVDPDGTRVRIDDRGLGIDLPDVDVGINAKGHPDVDVKTKGDNNAGPD